MALKPAELPDWATGAGASITSPSSGFRSTGFVPNTPAGAGLHNWFFNLVYQWLSWLQSDSWSAQTEANALLGGGTSVNVFSSGNRVLGAAAAQRRIVAVGAAGLISTSDDGGATWTSRTSGIVSNLNDVTNAGSPTFWVAVGDLGKILTSTDGVTWVTRTSGTTNSLNFVAGLPTNMLIGSNSGTVLVSSDGATWTAGQSAPNGMGILSAVYAISAGVWVMCGLGGTATRDSSVYRSTDNAANWLAVPLTFLGTDDRVVQLVSRSGTIYGLVVNQTTGQKQIIASTNNGASWHVSFTGGFISSSANYYLAEGSTNALFLVPDNPRLLGLVNYDGDNWNATFMPGLGALGRVQQLKLDNRGGPGARVWCALGANGSPDERGNVTLSKFFTF